MFHGVEIVGVSAMVRPEQFRFPRSKKKRIRTKWEKRSENWRAVPLDHFIQIGAALYGHPSLVARFKRLLPT
jgi:hypothetical protein